MVKSALVAMVVMGCDCDANLCEYIRETPPQWSTVAECEDALRHQTLTSGHMSYPVVTGVCRTTASPHPQVASLAPKVASPRPLADAPRRSSRSGVVGTGRAIVQRTATGSYTIVRDTLGRAASGTAAAARRTGKVVERLAANF